VRGGRRSPFWSPLSGGVVVVDMAEYTGRRRTADKYRQLQTTAERWSRTEPCSLVPRAVFAIRPGAAADGRGI
jgi:hypothetical protein